MADDEIEEPQAGGDTFKLWKSVAQLVRWVKPLSKIQIKPTGFGKIIYADGNCVFDFNQLRVAVAEVDDFDEGEPEIPNTNRITFSSLFKIHNMGSGNVQVDLNTQECECDDGTTDGGDSA